MLLRPFTFEDWLIIAKYQYPDSSEEEIRGMILQWNTRQYDGQYFEMLAIENDGNIVGYVSLLDRNDGVVSEGVEIYPPYRRQGFAYNAVTMALQYAKELGFQAVSAQVRQNNAASIALHKKLGFQITDSFCNGRGHLVYTLTMKLIDTSL